uniref:Xylulose kinase-1 n=1 Tax=Tanacetum cinerariifolium TaxID=118510 RepID=A0A6L2J9R3_TANCI|nr:hypothetical protein [Tanacetum cinerariifolium]
MIAILETYEHNTDFHQIVDFVEASHLRYALTINPTVYVSHIQQFWLTTRIETTDEGTKILATIDGKPRTISKSYIRRNLKLRDEEGISSLPDAELFENLTSMGYNILPNQKFSFQKGIPTEPQHTPSPEAQQTSPTAISLPSLPPVTTTTIPTVIPIDTPQLRQYTRRARIAQSSALPSVADEPASPIRDDSQGEAYPTDFGLEAEQDRANITKTSTLPNDSTPRVTSLAVDEGSMQHKLTELTDLSMVKLLEDKDGGGFAQSGEDAPIKGRSLDEGEEAAKERSTKRGSDDTEEMVTVLTSLDAASILTSGVSVSISSVTEVFVIEVPTGSGSIPTASPPGTGVPTGGVTTGIGVVPTPSLIFTTATVATPYTRRKEEELQIMIDGLDRNNETVAKYLQEYYQFAAELLIGERIELISNLVKYQDNYAKVLKYQIQQRNPLSKKQQKEFYMSVLRSHAGWKTRHFKGMTLAKVAKKVKTSEEVLEEDLKDMMQLVPVEEVYVEALQVKHPIIDWEVHTKGERSYWKIIRLGGSTTSYQFFVDMLKHFDREDLNQLWALVKETLNIRQVANDKEKELWVELKRLFEPDVEDQLWTHTQALIHDPVEWRLYDSCGVHHVLSKDQEIFMLVEKDYPLRKGLAIMMISNKLHMENYSQMANDLILKIHQIANSPRKRGD